MTAENVYQIAIHLPEKEMKKLYDMLGDNLAPQIKSLKSSKRILTDQEAIAYLLKNVFCKKH